MKYVPPPLPPTFAGIAESLTLGLFTFGVVTLVLGMAARWGCDEQIYLLFTSAFSLLTGCALATCALFWSDPD